MLSNLLQSMGRKPSSTHLVALSVMASWIDLYPAFELGRDLLGHWRIEVSDIFQALDHDLPAGQRLQTLAIASHLTFLLILLAGGSDWSELMESAVDGAGWLLDAAPPLQQEFDPLLADAVLDGCSAIGSQVRHRLLVM